MARKRKSIAPAEAPQEIEPVQPAPEPEPEPAREQEPEPAREQDPDPASEQEPEPEQEQNHQQVPEEDPAVGDESIGGEEKEEDEKQEDEEGVEDADTDMQEHNDDIVQPDSVKNDQHSEITGNPSDTAVPENGGEDEGDDDEEESVEKILEPFSKDQLTLLVKEAVAKHPDIVEIVHKLADSDPSHRKIFVHGLGWEANDETITSSFGKYGQIEDSKVVKDKISGKSKGYAFILFKHRKGARQALKEPQKIIEGRLASCQLASAGPVRAPTAPVMAAVSAASTESEYTRRKIYVSNVSPEIDPNKLVEFFSTFGEIEEGPLGLDKQTGKPRGFCLFVYKSLDSAKKALEEPHKTFEGQTLHCQKAVDGPKNTKGFFNPQQQSQPPRHNQSNQGQYRHTAKKGRYSGANEGVRSTGGHLMAPNAGQQMGYNPAVAPAAIGQAVAALLATQGAGLGFGNLLGGFGGGANQQGGPSMMNNAGYGAQGGGVYGGQPGMQGGYAAQPHMGRGGGVRPHQGGAHYMGPSGH